MEILHLRQPLRPLPACALTIGNFDGVHLGHQALLGALVDRARARGLPACVLTFEPHPREFFAARSGQPAPTRIATLRDKAAAMRTLGIDRLCIAPFGTALASLPAERFADEIVYGALAARTVLIGDDFRFGARRGGDLALLRKHGERIGADADSLETVGDGGSRISSSLVREALLAADFDRVTRLTGRPYSLSGHVVHGRKLGRQLGFPTMNLRLGRGKPSLSGVFAVRICGIGPDPAREWAAVASLGTRPAVETDGQPLLEVFVPGWRGDAYGKLVSVRFERKLRDEQNFPDLDMLKKQMVRDVEAAGLRMPAATPPTPPSPSTSPSSSSSPSPSLSPSPSPCSAPPASPLPSPPSHSPSPR